MHPQLDPTATPPTESTSEIPKSPTTIRDRIALRWFRFSARVNTGVMTAYLGAIGLVGIEGLAVVLSFSSMWPVGIPLIVGTLALIYFSRERLIDAWGRIRRRNHTGEQNGIDAEEQL